LKKKGEINMKEEPIPPLPNKHELIHGDIESELRNKGIVLQEIGTGTDATTTTVTTDKEVPEETKSRIREYAADKGIAVRFLTSE
jgi:hypothetical protein